KGQLPSASSNSSPTDPDTRGCSSGDFMDSFGIFLQGLLGVVAFSTLMCHPRFLTRSPPSHRPLLPFTSLRFLDTSKQAIGMLFIHFANVYLSDLTEEDPCSLYLINFLLDATLGMLVIYGGVKAVSAVVEWRQWDSLRFGEYGEPVQCSAWVGQCALYILIMMFEKVMIMLVPRVKSFILQPGSKMCLAYKVDQLYHRLFKLTSVTFFLIDYFILIMNRLRCLSCEYVVCVCVRKVPILFSADDEMEDSDGDDDVRRLTGLKPVKKKKHRLGIPV
uniref:STIM activating enhance n=1 Tax=Sinocyclocheilus grahami TaxID=75366 RepID=A0A672JZK7_SINGR